MKLKRILFSLFVVATLAVMSIVAIKGNNVEAATGSADSAAQELLTKYYNGGVYTKQTVINVKDETTAEVKKLFHAGANALERTTYYNVDELWMTNDAGTINSGYGTGDGHTTHFQKDASGNNVVDYTVSGVKDGRNWASMESAYVTLDDIKTSTGWETSGSAYVNTSAEVLDQFREFVAPMWLSGEATSNYVHFTKATIEQTSNGLVMKLYVDSTDSAKLTSADLVFAQATVTRGIYTVLVDGERHLIDINDESTNAYARAEYMVTLSVSKGSTFELQRYGFEELTINKYEGNLNSAKFVQEFDNCVVYVKFYDGAIDLYATSPEIIEEADININIWMNDWFGDASAKVYVYYWNASGNGWVKLNLSKNNGSYGDYFTCTLTGVKSVTGFKVVRFASTVSTPSWNATIWNQTGDISYNSYISKINSQGYYTYYC